MTENMQADNVQSRQAVFVRCYPNVDIEIQATIEANLMGYTLTSGQLNCIHEYHHKLKKMIK